MVNVSFSPELLADRSQVRSGDSQIKIIQNVHSHHWLQSAILCPRNQYVRPSTIFSWVFRFPWLWRWCYWSLLQELNHFQGGVPLIFFPFAASSEYFSIFNCNCSDGNFGGESHSCMDGVDWLGSDWSDQGDHYSIFAALSAPFDLYSTDVP